MMKVCTKCHTAKDVTAFYTDARTRDGLNPWCKECNRAARRQAYRLDPTRHQETLLAWRAAHAQKDRADHRVRNQRRRVRLKGGEVEQFTDIEIFERDSWICGWCGKKINRRRRSPDPLAASLDHIRPISKGGDHTRGNVQATHRRCNTAKGARLTT